MADPTEPTDPFAPLGPDERGTGEPPRLSDTIDTEWQPILPAPLPLPERIRHRRLGQPVAMWAYLSRDRRTLFYTARFVTAQGKEVLPYCCGADGWQFKAPPYPRPLYGLPGLAERPDAPVLLVEGEKTADAAAELFPDHVVVTWQGGSNAVAKADWRYLKGRSVVIWPDADLPGLKAAKDISRLLAATGVASCCTVAIPGGWPLGWDLADSPADLPGEMTAAGLRHMLEEAVAAAGAKAAEPERRATAARQSPEAGTFSDPEAMKAEVHRLSLLPADDYSAARQAAAQALGMGVGGLDKAVKAARAARRLKAEEDHRNLPPPANGEVRWPFGFFMTPNGLFADIGADANPLWLAPPFEVIGLARDEASGNWGTLLEWQDRDGQHHRQLIQNKMLVSPAGELEGMLIADGLTVETSGKAREQFRRALGGLHTDRRARIAKRCGWHEMPDGGAVYLLADGTVIGQAGEPVILGTEAENAAKMAALTGTIEGWQAEVAALAVGNPLAAFCIAAALAGPLLDVLGENSGGVHLFGPSKTGKTTALSMGCSVWGVPYKGGALRDWRSTSNAMEVAAEDASDGLLALDEIHQADPREVSTVIYALFNDGGKSRMNRNSHAQRRRTWRALAMSTGEIDVGTMVARAGERLPAGAQVRLPSLPVGADPWPELHGQPDRLALANLLHAGMKQHHGHAGRAFVAILAEARGREPGGLAELFDRIRGKLESKLPAEADAQVREVVRRFALVATAGELATTAGILPWAKGEAFRAAGTMMMRWLDHRGSADTSSEAQSVLARVRHFLVQHGVSRFPLFRKTPGGVLEEVAADRPMQNRAGWRRQTSDGRCDYLIDPSVWDEDVCRPAQLDPVEAKRALAEAGLLVHNKGTLLYRTTIPSIGIMWVIAVRPEILGEASPESDGEAGQ
jgi:putative DNA primase/helicase